jgi:hypothetical protein
MRIFVPKEKVEVIAYSGYRGEEVPRVFRWLGTKVGVAEIRKRWVEEGAEDRDTKRRFELIGTDGVAYSLIYDEQKQEWFCEPKRNDP